MPRMLGALPQVDTTQRMDICHLAAHMTKGLLLAIANRQAAYREYTANTITYAEYKEMLRTTRVAGKRARKDHKRQEVANINKLHLDKSPEGRKKLEHILANVARRGKNETPQYCQLCIGSNACRSQARSPRRSSNQARSTRPISPASEVATRAVKGAAPHCPSPGPSPPTRAHHVPLPLAAHLWRGGENIRHNVTFHKTHCLLGGS
jgi:hypothetical protein